MSRMPSYQAVADEPALTREALVTRFHTYGRPRAGWLVGGEFERILLHADGRQVTFDEPQGVEWLLGQLVARFGWEPFTEDGRLVELRRGGASTTLEPGGQVELSGAPHASLLALADEAMGSISELRAILDGTDIHLVALGLTPFAAIREVPWVPKGRYRVMADYLGDKGDLAHAMMKGTSSFQANFDFSDEADCARKVALLGRIGPLTTAMFANSPVYEGQVGEHVSRRGYIWTRTDPARTGFPEALREVYSHERWVDYLLDAPMMFYLREGRWAEAHGRTFRQYMDQGLDGHRPGWGDWELHQTSVFPEVRVKRTIEVRGADACPLPLALGGIALWTGLLYDDSALEEATALAAEFHRSGPVAERFAAACQLGMAAEAGGRRYSEWASELCAIGARGLSRSRPQERALLEPVEALVAHGESPGVAVRRIFGECNRPERFLRRVLY